MIKVAENTEVEKAVANLINAAWTWGESCGVDGIGFMDAGDSYNQVCRDKTNEVADVLFCLFQK